MVGVLCVSLKMKPNKSVLECPQCHKPLVNIASKVERIHPVARFINNHHMCIILVFFLISLGIFVALILANNLGDTHSHATMAKSAGKAKGAAYALVSAV